MKALLYVLAKLVVSARVEVVELTEEVPNPESKMPRSVRVPGDPRPTEERALNPDPELRLLDKEAGTINYQTLVDAGLVAEEQLPLIPATMPDDEFEVSEGPGGPEYTQTAPKAPGPPRKAKEAPIATQPDLLGPPPAPKAEVPMPEWLQSMRRKYPVETPNEAFDRAYYTEHNDNNQY